MDKWGILWISALICISLVNYFLIMWLVKKEKVKKGRLSYYLLHVIGVYTPIVSATALLFYLLTDTYHEWLLLCLLGATIFGVIELMGRAIQYIKYNWIIVPLGVIMILGIYYLMTRYTLDQSLLNYIVALLASINAVKKRATRNVTLIHSEIVISLIVAFIFCIYIDINYVGKPQRMVQELLVIQGLDQEYETIQYGRAKRGVPIEVIALRKYENSGIRERLTYEYYEGKITLIKEE